MPGPVLDLILQELKESDKEEFRKKILRMEQTEREVRSARGEMTRDMAMQADDIKAGQFYLDLEERKIARLIDKGILDEDAREPKPVVNKEEKEDDKTAYSKFLDQFK